MRPRRLLSAVAAALLLAALVPAGAALADPPDNPNCWGAVTSQRASTEHDLGAHSSAQDEPRLGLGNVARTILGDDAHVSDLGSALAELDDLPQTSCP